MGEVSRCYFVIWIAAGAIEEATRVVEEATRKRLVHYV